MRLCIPVASIGSTTKTLEPSGNFSGNLQIKYRKNVSKCAPALSRTVGCFI